MLLMLLMTGVGALGGGGLLGDGELSRLLLLVGGVIPDLGGRLDQQFRGFITSVADVLTRLAVVVGVGDDQLPHLLEELFLPNGGVVAQS